MYIIMLIMITTGKYLVVNMWTKCKVVHKNEPTMQHNNHCSHRACKLKPKSGNIYT